MYLGAPMIARNGSGGGAASQIIFYPREFPVPPPVWPGPRPPIITRPIDTAAPPAPTPVANAGTPVPAGFPTNQIFVNSDGSFWQYSSARGAWVNVGTPYNTGAAATPPAPPPSSTGSSTMPPSTTAPAPVSASGTPIVTGTSYQEILDWLNQDSLLATLGFAGIPNWITGAGVALVLYKVAGERTGRR
jgi:hypothetical protein